MPKFKVCVQQYVEETAFVMIEADTPELAMARGEAMLRDGTVEDWGAGDDIKDESVYAVLDMDDNMVWER